MNKPDTNEAGPGQEAAPRRARTPRKPGAEKQHIYLEPDEPTAEPEYILSIPISRDAVSLIERSDDFSEGVYMIKQTRANGQIVASFTHTKTARPETTIDLDEVEEPEPFDYEEARGAGAVDAATIAQVVEAVLDRRERRERARQQGQVDPMELAERTAKLMQEAAERERARFAETQTMIDRAIAARTPSGGSNPASEAVSLITSMADAMKSVQRLVPNPEKESTFDKVVNVTERVIDKAMEHGPKLLPIFIQAARARMAAQSGTPALGDIPTPAMPPQPAPAPEGAQTEVSEGEPLTFDGVIKNLANDILNNEKPDDGVDDVVHLVAAQPEFLPVVAGLMDTPTNDLIAQLSQATETNLTILANAPKYVEGLKKGVRARLQLPALAAPVLSSSNGQNVSEGVN